MTQRDPVSKTKSKQSNKKNILTCRLTLGENSRRSQVFGREKQEPLASQEFHDNEEDNEEGTDESKRGGRKTNHIFKDSEFPEAPKVSDRIQDSLAPTQNVKGSEQKEMRSFLQSEA